MRSTTNPQARASIEYVLQADDGRFLYRKTPADGYAAWGPSHRTVASMQEATRFTSKSAATYYVEQDEGSDWAGKDALRCGTLKIVAVKVIPEQVELVQ